MSPSTLSGRLWPVHPKPLPDELLSSWIVRLAAANQVKLHTFCTLAWPGRRLWSIDVDRSPDDNLVEVLAERTDTLRERVMATSLRRYQGVLYNVHHANATTHWLLPVGTRGTQRRLFGMQFCPRCLAKDEEPYFRTRWRLACTTVCVRHEVVLLDRCTRCEAPLRFFRTELGDRNKHESDPVTRCATCGADLREAEPSRTPELDGDTLLLHQTLHTSIHRGWVYVNGSGPVYGPLYFPILRRVAQLLGGDGAARRLRETACRRYGRPPFVPAAGTNRFQIEGLALRDRHLLVTLALLMLTDWPEGFVALCEEAGVARTRLLQGLPKPAPFWFDQVVTARLSGRTTFRLTEEEAEWVQRHRVTPSGARPRRNLKPYTAAEKKRAAQVTAEVVLATIDIAKSRLGLSYITIARSARLDPTTLENWRKGNGSPDVRSRARFAPLVDLVRRTSEHFPVADDARRWFQMPHPLLSDTKPVTVLRQGRIEDVLRLITRSSVSPLGGSSSSIPAAGHLSAAMHPAARQASQPERARAPAPGDDAPTARGRNAR